MAAILLAPPAAISSPASADAGKVTGVRGIFVKSNNPKALSQWYRDVLGIQTESWGGALLSYDRPDHPQHIVWNAFPSKSTYFAPSTRDFMINFAVDDLDAMIARL